MHGVHEVHRGIPVVNRVAGRLRRLARAAIPSDQHFLIGTHEQSSAFIAGLWPALREPIDFCNARDFRPRDVIGTLILHDAGEMPGAEQAALFAWLGAAQDTRVVTTICAPLLPRVESGLFLAALYYSTPGSVTPTTCSNALYAQALLYFNSLKAPAAFTPGDNDWTDCHRPSNGGFSSLERLEYERRVLFGTPFSFGKHRIRQNDQTAPLCLGTGGFVPCVENRRWTGGGVTYVTLNVQGSCNNLCDTAPDAAEFTARNHANIVWLHETFADAVARGSVAVMLIAQANPGWDLSDGTRAPLRNPRTLAETDGQPDGFVEYLTALREEVIAFRGPVAYVHGDSHYFRVDKPFQDSLGRRLENFTRVETFGDNAANGNNDVQWIKVTVDPRSREVFSFQPQIVPANRTAVPAP